jgi:Domain of unknown function (DUF6894)
MTSVHFHYSSARGVLIDRNGTVVDDLIEAREQSHRAARSLIMTDSTEDWRGWILHVTDDDGDEIFDLPFQLLLGKPH